MSQSLLSGSFGEPEGVGRLLSQREKAALENLIKNEVILNQIIINQQNGTSVEVWARFKPDATKITGSTTETLTAVRDAEGDYEVTSSKSAGSSGGHFLFGVLCSVSSKAGDGGDGSSPLKAFSDFNLEDTDDVASENFFAHPTSGKLYLIGSGADSVYIHDHNNFGSGPTIVDLGTSATEPAPFAGCVSKEGNYVVASGKDSAYNIRIMRTSDNVVADITDGSGNPTTNLYAVAARDDGTLSVWLWNSTAVVKYNPNFGTETLGAAVITYSSSGAWYGTSGAENQLPFLWDNDGYMWQATTNDTLVQIDPDANSAVEHAKPVASPVISSLIIGRLVYDSVRNRIFVATSDGTDRHIYEFSGWTNLNATSGTWRRVHTYLGGDFVAMHYDPTTGIMFISNGSTFVDRYLVGEPWQFIDRVPVDNTVANVDIDYDNWSNLTVWYEGTKGYVTGTNDGQGKMIQIVYEGANITPGGGGSFVTRFLDIMYEVTSATTAQIRIFDNTTQLLRDGEFTVKFIYP